MKIFIFLLSLFLFLNNCSFTGKKYSPIAKNIKDFDISVILNQKTLKFCEVQLSVLNNNPSKDEIYIEVKAFNRKDQLIGLFNFVIEDLKQGKRKNEVRILSEASFCKLVKRIEIYGG
jgi:hypothetical protein